MIKSKLKVFKESLAHIQNIILDDGVVAVPKDATMVFVGDGKTKGGIKVAQYYEPYSPSWHYITDDEFQNDWKNYDNGYSLAAYSINRDGLVSLKGLIYDGSTDDIGFVLPENMRPQKAIYIGDVVILNNGELYPKASYTRLDGINFYIK